MKVYNESQLAALLGMTPQNVNLKVKSGTYSPDVEDGEGRPRYFSEELALRLKSEREGRLRT